MKGGFKILIDKSSDVIDVDLGIILGKGPDVNLGLSNDVRVEMLGFFHASSFLIIFGLLLPRSLDRCLLLSLGFGRKLLLL